VTAKNAYAIWMCWCGEKQSSSVEINRIKLAYTIAYEAADNPRHMNSLWRLRAGQLHCFMRSLGRSTNTPLCALMP